MPSNVELLHVQGSNPAKRKELAGYREKVSITHHLPSELPGVKKQMQYCSSQLQPAIAQMNQPVH